MKIIEDNVAGFKTFRYVPLIEMLPKIVLQSSYLVSNGDRVYKPNCSGGTARIIIVPQQIGIKSIKHVQKDNSMGGFDTHAIDLDDSWEIINKSLDEPDLCPPERGSYCETDRGRAEFDRLVPDTAIANVYCSYNWQL